MAGPESLKPTETEIKPREKSPKKESEWIVTVASIRIFGPSGSAKTVIAEGLSQMYRIPIVTIGKDVRAVLGTDVDYTDREDEFDLAVDIRVLEILTQATPKEPVIVDAHLAGIFGNQVDRDHRAQRQNHLVGVNVLVVAKARERYRRIRDRQNKEREGKEEPELSLSYVTKKTRRRRKLNLEKWNRLYDFGGIDPFHPGAKDKHGEFIANIIINTTDTHSEEESILKAHQALVDAGVVKKRTELIQEEYHDDYEQTVYSL